MWPSVQYKELTMVEPLRAFFGFLEENKVKF